MAGQGQRREREKGQCRQGVEERGQCQLWQDAGRCQTWGLGVAARARTDRRHGGGGRMCTEGLSPDQALLP